MESLPDLLEEWPTCWGKLSGGVMRVVGGLKTPLE